MTVKLLQTYGKYPNGSLYTGDATTEAALVTAKMATTTLTGGTTFYPNALDVGEASAGLAIRKQVLTALAGGITGAQSKNYRSSLPLLASEALPLSTTVYAGQIYSSGGNAWSIVGQGATAASGPTPPANIGDLVTNGAATMFYLGPSKAVAASGPDTPVSAAGVTVASLGGGTRVYDMATYSSLVSIVASSGNYLIGGFLQVRGQFANGSTWYGDSSNANLIGYQNSRSCKFGIVTSSKRVAIYGTGSIPVYTTIEINGSPVTDFGTINQRSGPNPGCYLLTFADRRPREIWFFSPGNIGLDQIIVDTGEQIAPAPTGKVRVIVEGDSLTDGGNSNPVSWRLDWPSQVADACGIKDMWNFAIGGTGMVAVGGSNCPFTHPTRMQTIINGNPNIIMLAGDHNDRLDTSANRLPAIRTWFNTMRTALPKCSILTFGSALLRGEVNATSTQTDADLLQVINERRAAGDLLVDFIPVGTTSPGEPWLIDANVGVPYYSSTGDTHPSYWGIQYLASRYIAAFQGWVAANA